MQRLIPVISNDDLEWEVEGGISTVNSYLTCYKIFKNNRSNFAKEYLIEAEKKLDQILSPSSLLQNKTYRKEIATLQKKLFQLKESEDSVEIADYEVNTRKKMSR